jgi:hypothetical protein
MTIVDRPTTEYNQFRIKRPGEGRYYPLQSRGRSAFSKNLLHKNASQRVIKNPNRKSLKQKNVAITTDIDNMLAEASKYQDSLDLNRNHSDIKSQIQIYAGTENNNSMTTLGSKANYMKGKTYFTNKRSHSAYFGKNLQ